jgi:RNA polymerase sigma-70 factor (ECF subfamily)
VVERDGGNRMQDPDPRVLSRAKRGDLVAFEELVRDCQADVYRFALYLTRDHGIAEDVTQETFLRAFRFIHGFRGGTKFSSWLMRIARNCSMDALRRRPSDAALEEGPEPFARGLADPIVRAALAAALASVPLEQRETFLLTEVLGLSYQEAGDVLGVRLGTVKSRMFRARQALCVALSDEDEGLG